MTKYLKQSVLAAAVAVLALATPAFAQAPAHVSSSSSSGLVADGWGGAGLWLFHGGGDLGGTTTRFGLHVGGDAGIRLSETLSGVGIADLAFTFGDGTVVPITLGAGLRIDHAFPVVLTFGLGFVIDTGVTDLTPVGLGILAQGYYPLPSMPALGVGGQVGVHILNNSLTDFFFNGGVQYTFL